jgi:predicted ATP-binding protein involved in virulence
MTPFRISKLEINNIGSFGNMVLAFPEKPKNLHDKAEIHILTGENGTGKSTILEILAMMLSQQSPMNMPKTRYADTNSHFEVEFNNSSKREWQPYQDILQRNIPPQIEKLHNFWTKNYINWQKVPFSTAFFAYSGYRRVGQIDINGIKELSNHPFENALDFDKSIAPQNILQWITNTISKESLANMQGDVAIAKKYRTTISLLEKAVSQIIEQPIRFFLDYEPFNVNIELQGKRLKFNELPDGLKSIISWLLDLFMRMDRVKWMNDTPIFERNFILFLDEIEVHLHPAWQRKILPAVQFLFPNAQIFVSTHSPFVVGSIDGAWIHKLVKPNGDTKLANPPILSEDSHSVSYWLKEIFDIHEEFGQVAQQDLDRFYTLRNALLVNGTPEQRTEFKTITNALLNQNSREMETIVGFELRQLNKRLAQPIQL